MCSNCYLVVTNILITLSVIPFVTANSDNALRCNHDDPFKIMSEAENILDSGSPPEKIGKVTYNAYKTDDAAIICWNEKTVLKFNSNGDKYGYVVYSISFQLTSQKPELSNFNSNQLESYEVVREDGVKKNLQFVTTFENETLTIKENNTFICEDSRQYSTVYSQIFSSKKAEIKLKSQLNSFNSVQQASSRNAGFTKDKAVTITKEAASTPPTPTSVSEDLQKTTKITFGTRIFPEVTLQTAGNKSSNGIISNLLDKTKTASTFLSDVFKFFVPDALNNSSLEANPIETTTVSVASVATSEEPSTVAVNTKNETTTTLTAAPTTSNEPSIVAVNSRNKLTTVSDAVPATSDEVSIVAVNATNESTTASTAVPATSDEPSVVAVNARNEATAASAAVPATSEELSTVAVNSQNETQNNLNVVTDEIPVFIANRTFPDVVKETSSGTSNTLPYSDFSIEELTALLEITTPIAINETEEVTTANPISEKSEQSEKAVSERAQEITTPATTANNDYSFGKRTFFQTYGVTSPDPSQNQKFSETDPNNQLKSYQNYGASPEPNSFLNQETFNDEELANYSPYVYPESDPLAKVYFGQNANYNNPSGFETPDGNLLFRSLSGNTLQNKIINVKLSILDIKCSNGLISIKVALDILRKSGQTHHLEKDILINSVNENSEPLDYLVMKFYKEILSKYKPSCLSSINTLPTASFQSRINMQPPFGTLYEGKDGTLFVVPLDTEIPSGIQNDVPTKLFGTVFKGRDGQTYLIPAFTKNSLVRLYRGGNLLPRSFETPDRESKFYVVPLVNNGKTISRITANKLGGSEFDDPGNNFGDFFKKNFLNTQNFNQPYPLKARNSDDCRSCGKEFFSP